MTDQARVGQSVGRICGGCQRKLKPGDLYIEDSASGFVGREGDPEIDSIIADIMTGNDRLDSAAGTTMVFCEDCTEPGGHYQWKTYDGAED